MRRRADVRMAAEKELDIPPYCDTIGVVIKTYSTRRAAQLIGVSLATLKRWLASGKIRPSGATPMDGRTLWRFTDADVERFRKFKGTLKSGPKPKKKLK